MASCLGAVATLEKNPGSVSSTYMAANNHYNTNSRGSIPCLLLISVGSWHTHGAYTYKQAKHTYT